MALRDLIDRKGGITRRGFALGTVATGAALAAISLTGCGESERLEGEPQVVTDSSQIIDVMEEYEDGEIGGAVAQAWDIALGTVLFHCEGVWAAAMMAPESALHPNTVGVFSVTSGRLVPLLETAQKGGSYTFFDVRCGAGVFAWIEMDYAARDWVLLAQAFSDGALSGEAVQLDSGDADWEPAPFTCTGTSVIWQKMPLATGSKSSEFSHCYRWSVGEDEGKAIWESQGRFATGPRVANGILTIVPRVRVDEGTYYGMTALDLDGERLAQLDQLVLPSGVRPFDAVYTGSVFAFSIEAAYGRGGSLGQMGTFIGREGGPYVYFGREPSAQVMFSGARYLIKSQSAHYLVDTDAQQYQMVSSPDRSLGVGDFPASEGDVSNPLVFATIRDERGMPKAVTARVLTM